MKTRNNRIIINVVRFRWLSDSVLFGRSKKTASVYPYFKLFVTGLYIIFEQQTAIEKHGLFELRSSKLSKLVMSLSERVDIRIQRATIYELGLYKLMFV